MSRTADAHADEDPRTHTRAWYTVKGSAGRAELASAAKARFAQLPITCGAHCARPFT
ncbi:hypothetical protein FA95DRAFT_1555608 [Auriscalpium vulgare]|uniref:Uncharacterized protein n=1 Tax=Auriscalpium vulgare TaxID=40419 RepID=A0ACB8S3Z6_9AGAM|nr:hypothetical protein FA95DRAFT_1555608 [Auriscalpium vulgare]